ncbi:hypothetical protein Q8A67_024246 [Cirrhinus molitorella]|uniref:Uncharacterized protein n=1 Tax=Cirrhinus molitorella TaxID=172907 RepID=A0AA88TDB0_9TELE|nr:hypothetical protein Q8A67_024246 [Cirrhinus molitorella]
MGQPSRNRQENSCQFSSTPITHTISSNKHMREALDYCNIIGKDQLALFLLSQSHEGLIVTSTSSTALHSCPSSSNSILIGCRVSGLSVSASDTGSPHLVPHCAQAKSQGHVLGCSPGRFDERSHVLADTAVLFIQCLLELTLRASCPRSGLGLLGSRGVRLSDGRHITHVQNKTHSGDPY